MLLLAAGSIHLYLWFDYFRNVPTVGTLFLLNFAAALAIGLPLLIWATPLLVLAGIAFSVGTLAAFFASVNIGLFGYVERLRGPWQESAGGLELASLALLAPLLLIVLRSRQTPGVRLRSAPSGITEHR